MFGDPIQSLKTDGFWGPPVDFIVKDIYICSGGGCALRPAGSRIARTAMRAEPEKMSAAVPYLKYPEVLEGWVGGEKGFDPLGVTDALPVYLVREAELKHGRVCMHASIGSISTDLGVRFPGEVFQNVSTVEAHNKMVEAGIMGPFLSTIACYEIYSGWLFFQGWRARSSAMRV